MKLFLDTSEIALQPRRWASLLASDGLPAKSQRGGELQLVLNYLARHFGAERKLLCQRRKSTSTHARERYVLRPSASASAAGAGVTWVGLVCEYDAGKRALRIVDRVAVQPGPLLPFERTFTGEILLESRPLAPAYCDGDALAFLKKLPLAAEAEPAPTDSWRKYLEWRKKLAETKAAEAHPYTGWEKRPGRLVRFFLRDAIDVNKLRQRLQDEELRAGANAGDPRAPQGLFRRVSVVLGHPGVRRLAIELEFDALTYEGLRLPPQGELRVAMEGELSTLEIQMNGLRRLAEKQAQNPHLADWLFDISRAKPVPDASSVVWTPELTLNPEQREAVARALVLDDLLLLWGPPGTGKTTVIAEICAQYAARGKRILVASQANLAVEQALSRLPRRSDVRPAWVSTARKRDGTVGDVAGGMRRWLGSVGLEVARNADSHEAPWADYLAQWAKRLENLSEDDVTADDEVRYLRRANIIGATCNEAGKPDFIASPRFTARFDLVIVDEVSKATPPELLLAMLMGRRLLLVGDHRQLPPMFRDEAFEEAVENGELAREELDTYRDLVSSSLFDAYFRQAPASVRIGLPRQYRMHPRIMEAVNTFYADQPLQPGDGAAGLALLRAHSLRLATPAGKDWLQPDRSLLWIDTSDTPSGESPQDERVGSSRRNALEADLAAYIATELACLPESSGLSVAVISFYRAQVELLRDRMRGIEGLKGWLHTGRDINTVDQFQGSERDIVIVSLVRHDACLTGEFSRDFRRINVAFSRARRLLIILASRPTFGAADVQVHTATGEQATTKAYARIISLAQANQALIPVKSLYREEAAR